MSPPGPHTIAARHAAAQPRTRAPISTTILGREQPPAWARFTVRIAYYLTPDLRPSWEAGRNAPTQCFTSLARAREVKCHPIPAGYHGGR